MTNMKITIWLWRKPRMHRITFSSFQIINNYFLNKIRRFGNIHITSQNKFLTKLVPILNGFDLLG